MKLSSEIGKKDHKPETPQKAFHAKHKYIKCGQGLNEDAWSPQN